MKKIGMLIFILGIFIGCNKADDDNNKLSGTYIGYFHHNHHDTTQITIKFSDNNFQSFCSAKNYPALCRGSFKQKENTITFYDSCKRKNKVNDSRISKSEFNLEHHDDGTVRMWRFKKGSMDELILGQSNNQDNK